jgi:hypothetical protein
MEIHLVSSLTPDDESRLAPQVLAAIGSLLDGLPVAYSVRIETALGDAIHHNRKAGRPLTDDDEQRDLEFGEKPQNAHA